LGLEGSVLVVRGARDEAVQRAARNLPRVKVLLADGLNVYDVLGHANLVLTRAAMERVVARLGRKAGSKAAGDAAKNAESETGAETGGEAWTPPTSSSARWSPRRARW